MQIKASLFSDNKKKFFGRSYESTPMKIIKSIGKEENILEDPVIIYFHMKADRSEKIKIIFEVFVMYLNKKKDIEKKVRLGVAWTEALVEGER